MTVAYFRRIIFAILKAIEAIAGGPISDSEFYMIFVDSQTIASVWCKSRLVRKNKESLRTFGPDRIPQCCVLGHSGILGNATTDALARLGSLSDSDLVVGPNPPICHLYGLMNEWVRGEE